MVYYLKFVWQIQYTINYEKINVTIIGLLLFGALALPMTVFGRRIRNLQGQYA